jgi:hypothetical protein
MSRAVSALALVAVVAAPSVTLAKGGSGGSSGCNRIQSYSSEIAYRAPDAALISLNTYFTVKPCDKKENIALHHKIVEVATGTILFDYTDQFLNSAYFSYANFIPGGAYLVSMDVVDLRNGAVLESRSLTDIAPSVI